MTVKLLSLIQIVVPNNTHLIKRFVENIFHDPRTSPSPDYITFLTFSPNIPSIAVKKLLTNTQNIRFFTVTFYSYASKIVSGQCDNIKILHCD